MYNHLKIKNNQHNFSIIFLGFLFIIASLLLRLDSEYPQWNVERINNKAVFIENSSRNPVNISIPSVSIDTSIRPSRIIDDVWEVRKDSASHLIESSYPSEKGNIIIYAHNTPDLFGNLKKVKIGDIVMVRNQSGASRLYSVVNEFETSPKNMSVIEPTHYEMLTLYTCSGFADSKRLIVQALPILK